MLHHLETLVGHCVIATDGEIGSVQDFLFDDRTYVIHYLVVDVNRWLTRREVVIPVTAVKRIDWENKTLHIQLMKDQVRESPDVDTKESVSRQQEIAMRDYFGQFAYWLDRGSAMTSSMATVWITRCIPRGICIFVASRTSKDTRCWVRTVTLVV